MRPFPLGEAGLWPGAPSDSTDRATAAASGREGAIEDPQKANRFFFHCKRVVDCAIALSSLAVFGILLPLIALAIKLDSRGPVFYVQARVGLNRRRGSQHPPAGDNRRKILQPGRPFRLYKLRTMVVDAEAEGPRWATRHDERVTRVGRFLRRSRLDEFPQFLNVLRGEMSVIGPRPERLCFIRKLEPVVDRYHDRLLVVPGITGLAQIVNGYDTDVESVRRKVSLDRMYIQHVGPGLETAIFLHTFRVVFFGRGAR